MYCSFGSNNIRLQEKQSLKKKVNLKNNKYRFFFFALLFYESNLTDMQQEFYLRKR